MTDEGAPELRRRRLLIGLGILFLIGLPAGCFGYLRYWYPYWTRVAIESNRSYYEAMIRSIEMDSIPPGTSAVYRMAEDRLKGTITRISEEEFRKGDFYLLARTWRLVKARKSDHGSLRVIIPTYRLDLVGYGLMYSSTPLTPEQAAVEAGSEASASRFDDHWWVIDQWLGH